MIKTDFTKRGYNLNNALLLAEMSEMAYKSEKEIAEHNDRNWKYTNFKFFKGTQAFMVGNDSEIILVFRGTDSIEDFLTDFTLKLIRDPILGRSYGRVHRGFSRTLDIVSDSVEKAVKQFQRNSTHPLWLTGHSLGAALATLATARFFVKGRTVKGLYTFGSPRVGDDVFSDKFDPIFKRWTFSFINNQDIITRVPPRLAGYCHVGTIAYIDGGGIIHKDIRWWQRVLDQTTSDIVSALERYQSLKRANPDGFQDHEMYKYVKILSTNVKKM